MKFLYFLFIILASSTYRCADDDTIDCSEASKNMVGEWSGQISYSRPTSADGKKHNFSLHSNFFFRL